MRRTALLLALGACTPTHPKPAQEATPDEVPAEPVAAPEPAKVEAKAEAPVEAKIEEPAPVAAADVSDAPVDPRDIAARRAASPPSLVEPGRFHLAAYADDSRKIDVDVLGDAVVLRAPGALAVAEAGATAVRSEEAWVRGLDDFKWTWRPAAFYDEKLEPTSPLAHAFGGRWPDDVYFATADPSVEADFPPEPEGDPALLYKLGPDGWEKIFPEGPEQMDLFYSHFVSWREGQVIAAQVWHFDKIGFELDNGMGAACDDEFEEHDHDAHRRKIKYPKPPRQKFAVFGGDKPPVAPKGGIARLVASQRRTLVAFDEAGIPSRRVAGSTKWTPLPAGPEVGLPRALAVAADDTLYAEYCRGADGCSLHRLRGEAWAPVTLPDAAAAIVGLAVDARDDLWLATRDGLWRRKASARAPAVAGAPTDRSADAPLAADVPAPAEVEEPWERVALPGVRMPALALPRAVFGEQPGQFTWHMRPERQDMVEKTHALELQRLRVRGDELWLSASVDGAAVVLTTRAVTPAFVFPDYYVDSPNEYDFPEALGSDACPAVALRLGAVGPDAADDSRVLAALEGVPRESIAVVVAADPRELVAVWTAEIETAIGMENNLFLTKPAQLEAAKAALTTLGARLNELGVAKQAELACWAPEVARVLALPPTP